MLRIGDFEISRVEEITLELRSTLLPDWQPGKTSEDHAWLAPNFYNPQNDRFKVSIHSWLIKKDGLQLLIDTCAGNNKSRPSHRGINHLDTPWLERLDEAGAAPDDIDFVICTHFHVDHIGWNTRLVDDRWEPTFPKAKYIFPRLECEAILRSSGIEEPGATAQMMCRDSILPVIESGQAILVEGNESIADGVELIPTRGHSPGHFAVRIQSGGQEAMFAGDVLHHPLQIYHPDWNSALCEDADLARKSRRELLDHCVRHRSLLAPAHFAYPHCGEVKRDTFGFSFVPSECIP